MRPTRIAVILLTAVCAFGGGCGGKADILKDLLFGNGGSIKRELLGIGDELTLSPKGNAGSQAADIRFTLRLQHVRTTFFFDESFLASEASSPDFSRFDEIVNALPDGLDLLPILAYAPQWLANRADWKTVFVNRYVIPVVERYANRPRIAGWEIWNEPNNFCNGGGSTPAGVLDCTADDYVDLVKLVSPVIRARTSAPIVGAASLPINTNFPNNLDFNRRMVSLGILPFIDVYNFHWYSEQLERLALGIKDFLDGTGKPLWCTESGIQGSTRQLGFAQDVFPTLDQNLGRLDRIYIFTYFDNQPPDSAFGLVANNGNESDLYQFLRDHG